MTLSELLDHYLEEWLESTEHGQHIQEIFGIDGYVCIVNYIEFVKERYNADRNRNRESS